jgi:hypothetical protein
MQKKKIETLKDLRDEKKLVQERIYKLEQEILLDIQDIKKDLETWQTAGGAVKQLLTSKKTGILSASVGSAVDVFIKKLALRKAGFVTRFLVSFILKNFTRNYLEKNSTTIVQKIKNLAGKALHRTETSSE